MVGLVVEVEEIAVIMMPEEGEVGIDIGVEDISIDEVVYTAEVTLVH